MCKLRLLRRRPPGRFFHDEVVGLLSPPRDSDERRRRAEGRKEAAVKATSKLFSVAPMKLGTKKGKKAFYDGKWSSDDDGLRGGVHFYFLALPWPEVEKSGNCGFLNPPSGFPSFFGATGFVVYGRTHDSLSERRRRRRQRHVRIFQSRLQKRERGAV